MNTKKIFILFSVILNILALFVLVDFVNTPPFQIRQRGEKSLPSPNEMAEDKEVLSESTTFPLEKRLIKRVIDGDTVVLDNGQIVRYIGIDAPEKVGKKDAECYAENAYEANKNLVEGKYVLLEKDTSETDRFGRLLRYAWTLNEEGEMGIFVNEELVRFGYARTSLYPPDTAKKDIFNLAEIEAKEGNVGLWKDCY